MAPQLPTISHNKIILHVDDDPDDHLMVKEIIGEIDPAFVLHTAQNGIKALDYLMLAKLFNELPCLIILDLNMPVMNGYETYKALRKDPVFANIPVVIFTTSFQRRDLDFWENESVAMMTKPAQINSFIDSVKSILTHCRVI